MNLFQQAASTQSQESSWDRLREVYRYEGLHDVVSRTLKRAVKPIIQIDRYIVHERDLTVANSEITARVPLEVRLLKIGDAEDFAATFMQSAERVRQRLTNGDECIIGIVGNQMVHFQWFLVSSKLCRVPIGEFGLALVIRPGDVYSCSGYTLQDWRGKGIAAEVASVKHQYLRSLGCTRKFSDVRADNVQSSRAFGKVGNWTATRTVWVVRVFRSRRPWIFGTASDQSFCFVRSP